MQTKESLEGKTILNTGSTDGLGKLVAQHLAHQGAMVLLHGRNKEKGKSVLEELKRETGNNHLKYYNGDFASLKEVQGIKVNALHPASLMNTKMVLEDWDYSMSTVDQGAEAVEALLFIDVTGEYFDEKHTAIAISQTYDPEARGELKNVTLGILKKYLVL
jgi:hypothetical protein